MSAAARKTLRTPSALAAAQLVARDRLAPLQDGGGALRRRHHAGARRLDRSVRSARSDGAAIRARCARTAHGARRKPRSDRRRGAQPGRGYRAPLSGPGAAQARQCLRGVLPVLLPPRDGRAGAGRAVRRGARPGARLRRKPPGNLGSHPNRRRSAGALGAPAERGGDAASRDRPCQGDPRAHPRAGRGAGAGHGGLGACAAHETRRPLSCSMPIIRASSRQKSAPPARA